MASSTAFDAGSRPDRLSAPTWCAVIGCISSTPKDESGSPFHGNGEPLHAFVFTQFRTEGYGEDAELNRCVLFLELL
jgi:hypothetical protein